jgi:hypothetical protein
VGGMDNLGGKIPRGGRRHARRKRQPKRKDSLTFTLMCDTKILLYNKRKNTAVDSSFLHLKIQ